MNLFTIKVRFQRKRKRIIATMITKDDHRKIYIKDGELLLEVEDHEERKRTSVFFLDMLIDRFNRCDQRNKAIGYNDYKFTDFGFGFMTAIDFYEKTFNLVPELLKS